MRNDSIISGTCTCLHDSMHMCVYAHVRVCILMPATVTEERDYRHGPPAFRALVEVDEGTVVVAAHGHGRGEVLELANIGDCQHPCRISRFVREYSLGTLVQFTVEGAASLAHPHQQTKFCCTYVLARYLRALLSCLSRNSKTQGGRGKDRARNTGREVGEIARACARSEPMRECLSGTGEVAGERREGEERTQGGRGENARVNEG